MNIENYLLKYKNNIYNLLKEDSEFFVDDRLDIEYVFYNRLESFIDNIAVLNDSYEVLEFFKKYDPWMEESLKYARDENIPLEKLNSSILAKLFVKNYFLQHKYEIIDSLESDLILYREDISGVLN